MTFDGCCLFTQKTVHLHSYGNHISFTWEEEKKIESLELSYSLTSEEIEMCKLLYSEPAFQIRIEQQQHAQVRESIPCVGLFQKVE